MSFFGKLLNRGSKPLPDQTEAILQKHLDRDFIIFPMAEEQCSLDQVESIEKRIGVKYPREFVAHVCGRFPGIHVEVKEEFWPRPKLYDVGPFWTFLYGLHTFTPSAQSEEWMRLDIVAEQLQKETGSIAAPILKIVGDADMYCVNQNGQLVRYRHETNELEPVELSFWELFDREVAELIKRKEQKTSGTK